MRLFTLRPSLHPLPSLRLCRRARRPRPLRPRPPLRLLLLLRPPLPPQLSRRILAHRRQLRAKLPTACKTPRLSSAWQAVLATLKKNKAAYGVLFLNTKAVYDAGKRILLIEFPAENAFAFKAVQKQDVQDAVSAALTQACGSAVPFAYSQAGASAPASPAAASAARPASAVSASPAASAAPRAQAAASHAQAPVASTSRPQPQPQPQPSAAMPTYDVPPYEDEQVPYDDFDVPAPAPAMPDASPVPAAQPARMPQPQSAPASIPASAPATVQSSPADPSDLQAILAAGFGAGVVVEEVKE